MYRRILVPLDGSQLAEQALPYVRLLGRRLNLPVHLLRSYDVSPLDMGVLVSSGYLEEYLASLQAESGEYLSPVAEGLMQDGFTVTTGVLQGAAAPAIVAKTDNVPGTLVAMTTHGRSGLTRMVLGSVAYKVLHGTLAPFSSFGPNPRRTSVGI